MSYGFVSQYQELRTILCICPCCGEMVRVSDLRLSVEGKAPKTWLDEYEAELQRLASKQAEFEETAGEVRAAAIERGRQIVVERACECLDSSISRFKYNPYDIKALFHPADFIVFNGLNDESLSDVSFLCRASAVTPVQESLKTAIEAQRYDWKVARMTDEGGVEYE